MSMTTSELDLSSEFEPASEDQWRALVEKALKGGDFEKRLVSRSADNIALQPLYMQAADSQPIFGANAAQPWRIAQRVDHPDPKAANALALHDLEGGVDTLSLVVPDAGTAFGYGVALNSVDDLSDILTDISLEMIALRVEPTGSGKRIAALVAAYVDRQNLDPAKLSVNFGLDPIAGLMRNGSLAATWTDLAKDLAATLRDLRKRGFPAALMSCDTRPVHEAGGSEAQELALALASGVAYLRALSDNGLDLEEADASLSWTLAIDADQFIGIAKLRALRLLWARIQEASSLPARPINIHAETAWRMMSRRDPAVNMLRTTLATATASIGGADSIQVLPFTLALGLPNAFARRIARNTQTVLAEESNLWRVADPAAGSGAYESLTSELCEKAWAAFQEIETEGGIVASLESGALQKRIAAIRNARQTDIARRKIALTGTSEFPNLQETDETVLDVPAPATKIPAGERQGDITMSFADIATHLKDGASMASITPPPRASVDVAPLPSARLTAPFEALRDAADACTQASGMRPTVFLANLGPLAEHGTRATWIRNFMAAGGIDVITNDGFTNSTDAGKAFSDSGTLLACICGTDETYGQLAEATASLLKQAGAKKVCLAGRPGNAETALRSAGIDDFLYVGADILSALEALHEALDVKR